MDARLGSALGLEIIAAGELARSLGVSRATLSRLVDAAGDEVIRIGKTRATRYARVRRIAEVPTRIPVRRISAGGAPQEVGWLGPLAGRRHLFVRDGEEEVFEGLPPFVDDMRPQGFLGRRFNDRHVDLQLPARLADWSADDVLRALVQRGEDCVGDLVLGDRSFDRWLASEPVEIPRSQYAAAAREASAHGADSSAGGEHPKFAAWTGQRHVLVKYAGGVDAGPSAVRWRDLLACEAMALQVIDEADRRAARAQLVDADGMRFLEVERFDRVGGRGRTGLISLGAWDNEFLGTHRTWTSAAAEMAARGQLGAADSRDLRWLDVFGDLIANTDRHFWNVSFFWDTAGLPRLAPAYDTLPMLYAPGPEGIIARAYGPSAPTAATLDVWADAARWASAFWERVAASSEVTADFRRIANENGERLEAMRARFAHLSSVV